VGAALGFRLQGQDRVAVAFFGDGASCEGVFYESLNFASLKKLPVVFVCENNLYSTHMPIDEIQADPEIFRKASVFNMVGVRVDGNNVGRVLVTAREAVERARSGAGPTLIECMTYRWCGHVGPNTDIDKGLRSQKELDLWMSRCGVKRFEEYLIESDVLSWEQKEHILKQIRNEIEESINLAKQGPFPPPGELLEAVFRDNQRNQ
jgi:pyruvate dehydrogenase E1 component alpha subunit